MSRRAKASDERGSEKVHVVLVSSNSIIVNQNQRKNNPIL